MRETINGYSDFEKHVVDSLARLETNVDFLTTSLTGPEGRVTALESKVLKLIIGGVILAVLTLGPAAALAFLR